ncbi:BolA-like protein [Leptospira borgpetersenii serovar Ballum]|nr:BolA-like protein [Leptospira borgpetersenii serovar Ballum]
MVRSFYDWSSNLIVVCSFRALIEKRDRNPKLTYLQFMSVSEEIRSLLNSSLNPYRLEVEDLSAEHAGHTGNPENKPEGTHIKIILVSSKFSGKSKVEQHRMVYSVLKPWIDRGLHAIILETKERD